MLSCYFTELGLSILQKKDFHYSAPDVFFFNSLPNHLVYNYDSIYDAYVSHNITYKKMKNIIDSIPYGCLTTWSIYNNDLFNFWNDMKPLANAILDNTFKKCGLEKNILYPIIHFRCSDVPFIRSEHYYLQHYSFFKNSLQEIQERQGINKYDKVQIMNCSEHHSNQQNKTACKEYTDELQIYLKENGYESEFICNSNIDDFASLFYAPAVIST